MFDKGVPGNDWKHVKTVMYVGPSETGVDLHEVVVDGHACVIRERMLEHFTLIEEIQVD